MYKSMLNKFVQPTPCVRVDYDVYMNRQKQPTLKPTDPDDLVDRCCENRFVMFYSDLRDQAKLYGLLEHGSAHDLWEVIMNNVEIEVEDDLSDADVA